MNSKTFYTTALFKKNERATEKTVLNIGGARSGKSFALAQMLIMRALNAAGAQVAVTRKTMPALKMTAYRTVISLLKKYGLYKAKNHSKTEHFYRLGKSVIQFFSLDNPERIRSAEFNFIWMEEATEFSFDDYMTLLTRLSAPRAGHYNNQIFLSLNPSSENSWIARRTMGAPDTAVIKSTYKDNPFLDKAYIKTLMSLKNFDAEAYRVFALGEWGRRSDAVYSAYSYADVLPKGGEEFYGLDFGFNNPSALVKIVVKDGEIYASEELYKTGLTNAALVDNLSRIITNRRLTIYADAAEPDRIKEIYDAGFNIVPAVKNVSAGIMSVKERKLYIVKSAKNLIKEIQNYSWKKDLAGALLEEPVKTDDHALDALRYAVHTRFNGGGRAAPEVSFF